MVYMYIFRGLLWYRIYLEDYYGSMVLCYYVIMLLCYYVIMVLWYYGIMVLWYYGTFVGDGERVTGGEADISILDVGVVVGKKREGGVVVVESV
jgi:hypothetical protein